jgi:hypothetical protein
MLNLFIDTSVWLDLAKDYRQRPVLGTLEQLIKDRDISILLPTIVAEEFASNKERVARESTQSLAATFRRVCEAVDEFGHPDSKAALLDQLHDVDHRLGTLGEAVHASIARIEAIMAEARSLGTTETAKLAAAQRAIERKAPFHKAKNSMADALLIEIYGETASGDPDGAFCFVTRNWHDFSSADHRHPHPDLANLFGGRSFYSISLAETLRDNFPDWFEDQVFEFEYREEPRRLSEIDEAIELLFDQVWYNRHWNRRLRIMDEVLGENFDPDAEIPLFKQAELRKRIQEVALQAAARVEERRGPDNLGPWTDFEWGMINGKLSALRWVLGSEWDFLDT